MTDIDLFWFPVRAISMLEGPERLAGLAAERTDERPVVLIRDLAGPVVELELLQRGERTVTLLEQAQTPLVSRVRDEDVVPSPGPEERPGDVDDAGDREQGAESEGNDLHVERYAGWAAPSPAKRAASRRCSRASGHMTTTEPSTKIRPESQMRLTSGLTIASRTTDPSG